MRLGAWALDAARGKKSRRGYEGPACSRQATPCAPCAGVEGESWSPGSCRGRGRAKGLGRKMEVTGSINKT